LREEADLIRVLHACTSSPEEFEELASAIEGNDIDGLPDGLREAAMNHGVEQLLDEDLAPLDGLEIGVPDSGPPASTARGSLDLTVCGLAVSPLAKC
jgi:hypothetical protein